MADKLGARRGNCATAGSAQVPAGRTSRGSFPAAQEALSPAAGAVCECSCCCAAQYGRQGGGVSEQTPPQQHARPHRRARTPAWGCTHLVSVAWPNRGPPRLTSRGAAARACLGPCLRSRQSNGQALAPSPLPRAASPASTTKASQALNLAGLACAGGGASPRPPSCANGGEGGAHGPPTPLASIAPARSKTKPATQAQKASRRLQSENAESIKDDGKMPMMGRCQMCG